MSKIVYTEEPKRIVKFETVGAKIEITLTEGMVRMTNHVWNQYTFDAADLDTYIDALTMLQRLSK